MLLMGFSTLLVGLLPSYSSIGVIAPISLISLRLLQGLALGGEYGGAAVYVAEQAPAEQRGYYTSWIQATGTLGFLLSLAVILYCRLVTGAAFDTWGWRIPFWFSVLMLAISLWIRISMKESRTYLVAKAQGKLSRAPLKEVFGKKENVRKLFVALGGMVAGMTVVWYTSQFYVLYFLTQSLRVDPVTVNLLLGGALLLGSPFFVLSGRLSDRIGRKPVMMAGMLAAALTLMPLFRGLTHYANPQLAKAARSNPVVVGANPQTCGFQFDPLGERKNSSDCDKAKAFLSKMGVPYTNARLPSGTGLEIKIGSQMLKGFDPQTIQSALKAGTYPDGADPAQMNIGMILVLLTALIVLAAMIYGPLAAALVETFPTRIRYTALSVPLHVGVGWIGGLLPTVAFSLVVATGDIYYGLWYPVVIVFISFLIGLRYVQETRGRDILSG